MDVEELREEDKEINEVRAEIRENAEEMVGTERGICQSNGMAWSVME